MSRASALLRALLHGRRSFTVGPARYRERTTESLRRALSARGRGHKDYDVTFPDAASLRIRCTPARLYADIAGPHVLAPYQLSDPVVRPGMRVLDARAGTGFGAAHLADRVGPSGAVVALDPDHESIRYARRRYRTGTISFEIGGIEALRGELDAAFDAVVAIDFLREGADLQTQLAELWRVLAAGGPMVLSQPLPAASARAGEPAAAAGLPLRLTTPELRHLLDPLTPAPGIEPAETEEFASIIARKPGADARSAPAPKERPPYPPMR